MEPAQRRKIALSGVGLLFITVPAVFTTWWYIFSSTPPYQWFRENGFPTMNFPLLWIAVPVAVGFVILGAVLFSIRKENVSTPDSRYIHARIVSAPNIPLPDIVNRPLFQGQTKTNEDEAVHECFEKAVVAIKAETDFTFNALWIAGGHLLPSNDLVVRVCDRLVEEGYFHPFTGLSAYVPESEYLDFLRYVKYNAENADVKPDKGHTYLDAAERWRRRQGHPEPSPEQSLQMVFAKAFEMPPMVKQRESKGLKVSVDEVRLETLPTQPDDPRLSRASVRLMFVNDGPTPRSILVLEFLYSAPEKVWDGHYETLRAYKDNDSRFETLAVDCGTEVVHVFKTHLATELVEQATAEIGVKIVASDGRGLSKSKIFKLITIKQMGPGGKIEYYISEPKRMSLD